MSPGRFPERGPTRPAGEACGSGTVWVLAAAALLAAVGAAAVALGAAVVARHRADSAADLAALAAASAARDGLDGCAAARAVAEAVAAAVRRCSVVAGVAEVAVEVRPEGLAGRVGLASARARAGPASP